MFVYFLITLFLLFIHETKQMDSNYSCYLRQEGCFPEMIVLSWYAPNIDHSLKISFKQ